MGLNKISQTKGLEFFSAETVTKLELPFILTEVNAGFPSPAGDYIELPLDLNEYLIQHPAATYYIRVKGYSMKDANIDDGDILIVDRAIEPTDGSIIVCAVNSEFTVKQFWKETDHILLAPANNEYKPIIISDDTQIDSFGVVTYIIHKAQYVRPRRLQ